ncbi:TolC family protein [Burkholderiaceae bacterium FT117]|uniref:TolC family protein n=1 Tax=Zeimonas sediminis TaxID=2944268 RepID=UPI002342F345|nr:TolC family protein [Zeimonas sediminis]MCM5570675.1 TolC family protein [Zeimonas sediminis]
MSGASGTLHGRQARRLPARRRPAQAVAVALAALALAGCAQFSADGGLDPARTLATERFGTKVQPLRDDAARAGVDAEIDQLLASELDADAAVRIALLGSPTLQASFARLGIAEADLVQAGRLRNPVLSWMKVDNDGGDSKREGVLLFDVGNLLLMPLAREVEGRRFEAAQLSAAAAVARVALDARAAWFDAVAARQAERYQRDVVEAAELGRDLAVRMARVGNWPQGSAVREQLLYAESVAQLERARQHAVATRERLVRALGLWGPRAELKLPDRLPPLPDRLAGPGNVEAEAMRQRYDIAAARAGLEGTARALGLTRASRFVSLLELGPAQVREGDHDWMRGYELELSIPLFDWGGAKVAKAEAIYMQAAADAARVAIDARSEVRESWQAWQSAWELARHYRDEIVPLRKRISDERLRKYNGMLIGVFDLLADAGQQAATINAAIAAQRDFWLADVRMQAAMLGTGGPAGAAASPAGAPAGAMRAGAGADPH